MRNSLSLLILTSIILGSPSGAVERVIGGVLTGPALEPTLRVEPSTERLHDGSQLVEGALARTDFLVRYGGDWEIQWDLRSDRAHLVQGLGIALWPGNGNEL